VGRAVDAYFRTMKQLSNDDPVIRVAFWRVRRPPQYPQQEWIWSMDGLACESDAGGDVLCSAPSLTPRSEGGNIEDTTAACLRKRMLPGASLHS
jgi:hypothetical protein